MNLSLSKLCFKDKVDTPLKPARYASHVTSWEFVSDAVAARRRHPSPFSLFVAVEFVLYPPFIHSRTRRQLS